MQYFIIFGAILSIKAAHSCLKLLTATTVAYLNNIMNNEYNTPQRTIF